MVILGQYTPGLNGDDVGRELRAVEADLPLVAITSDEICISRLKTNGFDRIYVKPLRSEHHKELLETMV